MNQFNRSTFRISGTRTALLGVLFSALVLSACKRGSDGDAEADIDETQVALAPPATEPDEEAPSAPPEEAQAPPPQRPVVPTPRDRTDDVSENRALAARLGLAPPDPLLVSDLLTRADVRELTNFEGELLETSLEGIPAGPAYNAIRLQADGGYGFALQVWQHDEIRTLAAQFTRLRETYFSSEVDASGVGNEAFSADFQGIVHYAFLHRASKSIAVVTCQRGICDPTQARNIAERVSRRL